MNRGRLLVGGLVFGCLLAIALLIMALPTLAAEEASITQTTLEDFNTGTLYHTGLVRYDDGEVQLMSVGISGEWITDTNNTNLPALDRLTAVHHKGHIIVLGGRDKDGAQDQAFYTTIDPTDHDLADWQADPDYLPYASGIYWHASVVFGDWVYIIGGTADEITNFDTVSYAKINADGSLGNWQTTTAAYPLRVRTPEAAVLDGRIYVVGGWDDGTPNERRDEVYYATPDPTTGNITSWTKTTADFAHTVNGHMIAVYSDTLYVMGGYPIFPGPAFSPWVHHGVPDPTTGDITSWTKDTDLPKNLYGGEGLAYNGVLFSTGGSEDSLSDASNYVGASPINTNRTVGAWVETSLINPKRFFHGAVTSDDGWLYVINGNDGSGPISSVNRGSVVGEAAHYVAEGTFTSSSLDLGRLSPLKQLQWNTTMAAPSVMGIQMWYRTAQVPGNWSGWTAVTDPSPGATGTVTKTVSLAGVARFFQYKAGFSTTDDTQTPYLNAVRLVYEKPTYAMDVSKNANPAPGSTVKPLNTIAYTLTYANVSEEVSVTQATVIDTIPDYTTYKPGSIWGPGADDSNPDQLHWNLGDLLAETQGEVGFSVIVDFEIYEPVTIENRATMTSTDAAAATSNLVIHPVEPLKFEIDVDKTSDPAPGTVVAPGDRITYTIDYHNTGELTATQATLTDTFLPHTNYTITWANPAVGGIPAVWDLGTLDVDESGQTQLAIELDDILWPKDFVVSNQATVGSPGKPAQESEEVTHTVSMPGQLYPDLVIENLRLVPARPVPTKPAILYVKIANRGDLPTNTAFWLEVYIKTDPSAAPSGPSDHDLGFCLDDCATSRPDFVEQISNLPVDATFEVSFSGDEIVFPVEGDYDIYAQVDVAFSGPQYNPYWGAIPEESESNNIRHQKIYVGPPRVYLPCVHRNVP